MYNAWFALSGVICEKIIKEFKDKACFFCTGRYNDPIETKQAKRLQNDKVDQQQKRKW